MDITVDYLPSPRPKTKDPKIIERNQAIAERIEAAQQGVDSKKKGVDVISELVVAFSACGSGTRSRMVTDRCTKTGDGPPKTISLSGLSSADAFKQLQAAAAVDAATSSSSGPASAANEGEGAAAASSVSDGVAAAA